MDIYVYNSALDVIGVIDTFISVIWAARYYKNGDFELVMSANAKYLGYLQNGYFLVRDKDISPDGTKKNVMVIQNIDLKSDPENGDILTVTGKGLASILDQRVIARQSTLAGDIRDIICLAVAENMAYPTTAARAVANLTIASVPKFNVTDNIQVTGDSLGEWVSVMCEKYGIGYDIYISGNNFVFTLYAGTDRSTQQTAVPQVVFSQEFENLINTDYQFTGENFKNTAIVAGEGEGAGKIVQTVGNFSGLSRYEVYVDANDVSTNEGNISESAYINLLYNKGIEALTEYINNELFDGETDTTTQYIYGEDFYMGDIVEIETPYGISAAVRIVEAIDSADANGQSVIPTFTVISMA
jgi:putative component of toxin-antitoxin plasmid stabilization module